MHAISDTGSLVDGPARTVILVLAGLACAGFAVAWLLCRAAAVADRAEPGCEEQAWLDYERSDRRYGERAWFDHCERCDGRHVFTRQVGVEGCLICDEPQAYTSTEVYDHLQVEALHADLAAFERGERWVGT